MVICVDFDGTCEIGAVEVLKKLILNNHKLILFTMRSGKKLAEAVEWFNKHDIVLYGINTNPTQHTWTTSPKAHASLYIDDRRLGVPLIYNEFEEEAEFYNQVYFQFQYL